MSFESIKELLATGRKGSNKKRLSGRGNTHLHLIAESGAIALKYHETDVAIFTPEYVELHSGGWFTATTKERINEALRLAEIGYNTRVRQFKKIWRIAGAEFFEGIRVDYSGQVLNAQTPTPEVKNLRSVADKELISDVDNPELTRRLKEHEPEARQIAKLLIDRYVKKLSQAIDNNTLNLEVGGGDCWMCSLVIAEGKDKGQTWGDSRGDIDHLVSHLKENYLMVRLVFNALTHVGYRWPAIFLARDGKPNIETIRQHKDSILRAVRRYFEEKLLTKLVTC